MTHTHGGTDVPECTTCTTVDCSNYPDLIMVGGPEESKQARDNGWEVRDIVYPITQEMAGRRYKTLHITWQALDTAIAFDRGALISHLESDHVLMKTKITVGHVTPPPQKNDEGQLGGWWDGSRYIRYAGRECQDSCSRRNTKVKANKVVANKTIPIDPITGRDNERYHCAQAYDVNGLNKVALQYFVNQLPDGPYLKIEIEEYMIPDVNRIHATWLAPKEEEDANS